MPLRVVRKDDLHHQETDWLSTYWHFSFDRYFDPANVHFGPLRVFNDDEVAPGGGWGMHPHRDMEIVTYVVEGRIAHEDSTGGHGVLEAGDVQAMTAGRGIRHAEYNPSEEEALRLLQIWIQPQERGLPPSYRGRSLGTETWNTLVPVIGGPDTDAGLPIQQDARMLVARLNAHKGVEIAVKDSRLGYLYVVEGAVGRDEEALRKRDVLRVRGPEEFEVEAQEETELLLLDLPLA